jgi:hypothetical protein
MVRLAIFDGLVLSAAVAALLLAILRINPEMMLNDYPADIRGKFGKISVKAKRQRAVASVIMLAVIVAIMSWSFRRLDRMVGGDITVGDAFQHLLIAWMIFNLVDLVLIDFVLVRMQPRFLVLPGTEGMAGYGNYRHHVVGFLWGLFTIPIAAAGIGWIVARFM